MINIEKIGRYVVEVEENHLEREKLAAPRGVLLGLAISSILWVLIIWGMFSLM